MKKNNFSQLLDVNAQVYEKNTHNATISDPIPQFFCLFNIIKFAMDCPFSFFSILWTL
jgi:hypothetical protein